MSKLKTSAELLAIAVKNSEEYKQNNMPEHVVGYLTCEELEASQGAELTLHTNKLFFRCGRIEGPVSQKLQEKLKLGETPNFKVQVTDSKPSEEFPKGFVGNILIEDTF